MLLLQLYSKAFSGLATLQKDKIVRRVSFRDGKPLNVTSNLRSETLGPLLNSLNKISAAEADQLQELAAKNPQTPTALISQLGRFSEEEARELAYLVQKRRLANLFSLRSGYCELGALIPKPTGTPVQNFLRIYCNAISEYFDSPRIAQYHADICPSNLIIYNRDAWEHLTELSLLPEEKGVLTIASGAETVKQVYEESLLDSEEIGQNLLKLKLLGIISLESKSAREDREFLQKLSNRQKQLKHKVETMLTRQEQRTNYFELIGLTAEATEEDILARCKEFSREFSIDTVRPLFPPAQQQKVERFLQLLKRLMPTLSSNAKREEYRAFLQEGGQGTFEQQSKTIAADSALKQGKALFQAGKFPEACEALQAGLQRGGEDPLLLAWSGRALQRLGETAKAESQLQAASQKNPDCLDAYLFMAEAKHQQQQQEAARKHLVEILKRDPTHAAATQLLREVDPAHSTAIEVIAIHRTLDQLDYYTILAVERHANRAQIQKAYHTRTRQFHPDRFFTSTDASLKTKAAAIHKRCVEAYMVLRNETKKREYDKQLKQTTSKVESLRLKDAGDVVQKKERSDIQIKNSQAKKFYTMAMTNLQQQDYNGAILNLQLALRAEPNNTFIQKRLQQAENKAKG